MATKELGYVELEWRCPRCRTRNPGTQTTCSGCGAPQPENVQFEAPAGGALVEDREKIARAQSGPDIQCAYCGTRNLATAEVCKQCGADLKQGKAREAGGIVGAFHSRPAPEVNCTTCGTANPATALVCQNCGAPLPRPEATAAAPAPLPAPARRGGNSWWVWAVIALAVGALVWFGALTLRTTELTGTVQDARWVRTIPVEALAPVERSAWRNELPAGVEPLSCRAEVRSVRDSPAPNAREVCGTPYTVDTGTGMGRVVQDCRYEVYDDRCTYTSEEWRVVNVLEHSGAGFEPEWPVFAPEPRQRLGAGRERFQCIIRSDERTFTYEPRTFEQYLQCQPGSQWELEVNGFGALTAAQRQR